MGVEFRDRSGQVAVSQGLSVEHEQGSQHVYGRVGTVVLHSAVEPHAADRSRGSRL